MPTFAAETNKNKDMGYILQISLYDTLSEKENKISVLYTLLSNEPSLAHIHNILRKYYEDCRYCFALTLHYAPYSLNSILKFTDEVNHAFMDSECKVVYDSSHIMTEDFPISDGLIREIGY